MNRLLSQLLSLLALAAALSCPVAQPTRADESKGSELMEPPQAAFLRKVDFVQRLNNQVPVDLKFTNDRGEDVTIAECMNGRPTIFVLAYYRCPMLCNQVLNGVARTVQGIDLDPGEEIEIVVVSFDPSDTVELAAQKKEAVVHAYSHKADGKGWHFLIGDEKTVAAAAESVGFQYQYDEQSKQYAHASGITVLTPDGRVSKYFYGIDYPTRDVRLGLIEASEGNIGTPVDRLLLYCFHYDPITGRYGLAIMSVVRAGGVLTVAGVLGFITVSLRRERRNSRESRVESLEPEEAGP
ncbi:MAG TPA: SCO family protein [Lacipirellula sp.]